MGRHRLVLSQPLGSHRRGRRRHYIVAEGGGGPRVCNRAHIGMRSQADFITQDLSGEGKLLSVAQILEMEVEVKGWRVKKSKANDYLDDMGVSEQAHREREDLMYRFGSGDSGWNEVTFFQGKPKTVNGRVMEAVPRTEGSQRSVEHKGKRRQSNNKCTRVYKKNNTLTWRSVQNVFGCI